MLTVKGENEREKCVIPIQLERVASGMDRLFSGGQRIPN